LQNFYYLLRMIIFADFNRILFQLLCKPNLS
jgi:hypothetical protein